MTDNLVAKIIENQEQQRKEQSKKSEWGLSNVRVLNDILEQNDINITNSVWDLLVFNVNGLRINEYGKVCYLSFYKPSKKLLTLFARYNNLIVENFDKITKAI